VSQEMPVVLIASFSTCTAAGRAVCPAEDIVFVADMNNWRVQKLIRDRP